MALTVTVPEQNPTTGTSGTQVRPITEGETMTAVPSYQNQGGFWGYLDQIGGVIGNTVGQAVQIKADNYIDKIDNNTPAATIDSTGDPFDNPQNTQVNDNRTFVDKYKRELMIGGAVVGGLLALYIISRD